MPKNISDASGEYNELKKVVKDLAKALEGGTKNVKKMDKAISGGMTGVRNLRNQVKGLTDRVKDQNKEIPKGTSAWNKYGRQLSIVRSRMLIVAFAGRMVANTIGRMFVASAEQQQSEIKLATALGRTSKELLKHASAIQGNTRFGDESVIAVQASIAAFIQDEEVIKSLTEATLDLASAKGMDLVAAADIVAKSVGSSTNALSRYGIAATGAAKSTERAESVLKNISVLYGGQAKAQAESYAGSIDQMKNAMGDAAEAIGELLAPIILTLIHGLKNATNMVESLVDWLTTVSISVDNFFFGLTNLKEATFDYTKSLADFQKGLSDLTFGELTDEAQQLNDFLNPLAENTNALIGEFDELVAINESVAISTHVVLEENGKLVESTKAVANALAQEEDSKNRLILINKQIGQQQAFAQELYSKTAVSQIAATQKMLDWVKANKAAFESNEAYIASLKMLEAQMDSLEKKEDVLLQKRIQGIGLATSAFSSMVSAQKTEIESRMNAELTSLRETTRFQRLSSDQRAIEEKKITAKFKAERKSNWENEKTAKIAQATLNAYQAVSKAWAIGGPFGAVLAGIVAISAFKQVTAMMAVKPPAFARGGDFTTTGPQMIMVGDNPGGRERVQVTPLSSPNIAGPQGGSSVTVNVSGNVLSQDFVEGELAENIKEAIRRGTDFGIS